MRFLCYELCHLSSAPAVCWKIDLLTAWCRSSVVSVSLQSRLSFSVKISQGYWGKMPWPALVEKAANAVPLVLWWDVSSVHAARLRERWCLHPWPICSCFHVAAKCHETHSVVSPAVLRESTDWLVPDGCFREVKKAPACIVPWHDPHKQLKFRPVWRLPIVKGRARDRITLMTITRGASVLRKEHIAAG